MAEKYEKYITNIFLNDKDARNKIDDLTKRVKELNQQKHEALERGDGKAFRQAEKEIRECEKRMKVLSTTAQSVSYVLGNLKTSSYSDLQKTIKAINKELASGRITRGTEEYKILTEQLSRLKTELKSIQDESKAADTKGFFGNSFDFLNKNWGALTQIWEGATGLSDTIRKTTQDFLDFDTAMANVRKYTGQTAEEVEAMNEKFKEMDTRTPINELNELAGAAGRLGITAEKDILEFVEAADKIGVALGDDLGEGAVDQIGKLAMAFGEDDKMGLRGAMLATGSAINELAQNSAAKANYLVEFGARIAAVGNQVGMTQAQIFGLGAVLDENMQKDEMAATAVSQLLIKMSTDTATFARLAGVPMEKFSQMIKEDFNGALTALFRNLSKVGDMQSLANMFEDMGLDGTRCVTVLSTMAGKIDDITRLQDLATEAYKQGTSVIDEYNVQNNTLQAEVDKAKKKFLELSVALGQDLLPVVKYTVSTGSLLVKVLSTLIGFVKKHIVAIAAVTSAIVAYNAAMLISNNLYKLHYAWLVLVEGAQKAMKLTTLALNAVWAVLTGNVTRATAAMRMFNAVSKANPWGLLAAVITAAVAALATWIMTSDKATEAERRHAREVNNLIKAKQRVQDLETKAASDAEKSTVRIRKLNDVLHNGNLKYSQRKAALDELQRIIPEYHAQLTKEGELLKDNTEAIDGYINKLIMQATVNAFADDLAQMNKELAELELKRDRINGSINAVNRQMGKTNQKETVINPYTGDLQEVTTEEWHKQDEALKHHTQRLNDVQEKIDEVNAHINETGKALDKVMEKSGDAVKALAGDGTGNGTGNGTGGYKSEKERKKEEAERKKAEAERKKKEKELNDKAKADTERRLAEEIEAYAQGTRSYSEHIEAMKRIQLEGIQARKGIYAQDSAEYQQLLADEKEISAKHQEELNKQSLQDIERRRVVKAAILKADFEREGSEVYHNEDALNEALFRNEMEAMQERIAALKKGSKEWYDTKAKMEAAEEQHSLDQRQRYLERLQEYREKYGQMDIEEQKDIAMKGLEALKEHGLKSEEEYQQMRLAIIAQYAKMGAETEREARTKPTDDILATADSAVDSKTKAIGNSNLENAGIAGNTVRIANTIQQYQTMYERIEQMQAENVISEQQAAEAKKQLWNDTMAAIASTAQAAYENINTIVNAASAYSRACSDYEVAKITANYDKQIEAAGKNSRKREKLEKERDKKIQAVKTAANKKAMKIEIAQAFASTAMAAINAYSSAAQVPLIGYILAPIAAAAATAAGMLQIATIKKQHQAEQAGYYDGGFTGGRRYRKEAGVVHEGEFVANHMAVNNPAIRPTLELIDKAQRNNTVARLTAEDVRLSAGGEAAAVVAPVVNVTTDNQELKNTISELNDVIAGLRTQLEEGITAYSVIDGPNGVAHQLNRYNKLKRG